MKLNVEMMQSSAEMYLLAQRSKILFNGVQYHKVVEADEEKGYLDYIPEMGILNGRLLTNRIFGKVEIRIPNDH